MRPQKGNGLQLRFGFLNPGNDNNGHTTLHVTFPIIFGLYNSLPT